MALPAPRPPGDRAGAVERAEHAEEGATAVQAVMHDGEGDHLGQDHAARAEHDGGQDRAQHRGREEVAEAREELARAYKR